MSVEVFYDADADLSLIRGRTVAVLGYGSSLVVAVVTGIVTALLKTQPPTVAWSAQVASWFLVAFFTNGLLNAFFYASFMMSTHGRGHALEPMAWHTKPSRPQPSQS